MLVLHLCALAIARLAMVFSSLSGTQRQCRVVAALAIMEAAALPRTFLGVASKNRHVQPPCEALGIASASLLVEDGSSCTHRADEERRPEFYASLASLMHWAGMMLTHIVAVAALLQHLPPLWHWLFSAQKSLWMRWSRLTVNEPAVVDEFCKFLPEQTPIIADVPLRVRRASSVADRCLQVAVGASEEQMILGKIRLAEELLLRVKNHEIELRSELVGILSALACSGES